jgi:hypothetical protein
MYQELLHYCDSVPNETHSLEFPMTIRPVGVCNIWNTASTVFNINIADAELGSRTQPSGSSNISTISEGLPENLNWCTTIMKKVIKYIKWCGDFETQKLTADMGNTRITT